MKPRPVSANGARECRVLFMGIRKIRHNWKARGTRGQLFEMPEQYFIFIGACLLTFCFALWCKLMVVFEDRDWFIDHGDAIAATLLSIVVFLWFYLMIKSVLSHG